MEKKDKNNTAEHDNKKKVSTCHMHMHAYVPVYFYHLWRKTAEHPWLCYPHLHALD